MAKYYFDEEFFQQSKRTTKMMIVQGTINDIRKVDILGFDEESSIGLKFIYGGE